MRTAVFSTKPYDRRSLETANRGHGHELVFFEHRLTPETSGLAKGFPAVCAFVNDDLGGEVLADLARSGTRLVALRAAGFNHVDLPAAEREGITVVRVPAYSPHAVAEHTLGLILTLNRKFHRAYNRVREGNFSLDGLLGFDLHARTVGVVGTGRIGATVARIVHAFGCRLLLHDPRRDEGLERLGACYVELEALFRDSDIVSLHCPLTRETHHLVDAAALRLMRPGVMLINTGRGALINTADVIAALKAGKIGYLGLDVYEEEEKLFFEDLSREVIQDDVFARLLTFPNVLITAHQAFFTEEALRSIAETTLRNIAAFETGRGEMHTIGRQARGSGG
jgi:D-lactate dehydrogenase